MKKEKVKQEKKKQEKEHRSYDKGQIFVKIMSAILVLMMLVSAGASLIFSLLG